MNLVLFLNKWYLNCYKWYKNFLHTLHHLSLMLTSYVTIINDQKQETNIDTILLTNQRPYLNITNCPSYMFSWSRKKDPIQGLALHLVIMTPESLNTEQFCFALFH